MKNIEFRMSALPMEEEESINTYKEIEEKEERLAYESILIANMENAMHGNSHSIIC